MRRFLFARGKETSRVLLNKTQSYFLYVKSWQVVLCEVYFSREVITSSISPYSHASAALIKLSLSVSAEIFSRV